MKCLKVFSDFVETTEELSDAELGRLFREMMKYEFRAEESTISGSERFLWKTAKKDIDLQRSKYSKQIASLEHANSYNPKHNGNPLETHSISNGVPMETQSKPIGKPISEKGEEKERDIPPTPPIEKDKESPKRNTNNRVFIPPTIEDVREYCLQQGYKIDTERFVDYYTSNGWMVGRNKMKDWKAAVRTWVRSSKGGEKKTNNIFLQIMEDEYGQIPNNIGTFGS